VHRWSILIIVQQDATQSSLFIILQVHSTCFWCQPRPSSGVHKTVTTASGSGHIICAATSLPRDLAWPRWREVAVPVSEAVVTVLCTPDDWCVWHPKHVEWTCRIINRLLCVASRWTIINYRYTGTVTERQVSAYISSLLILSSNLCPDFINITFHSGFWTKILYALLHFPMVRYYILFYSSPSRPRTHSLQILLNTYELLRTTHAKCVEMHCRDKTWPLDCKCKTLGTASPCVDLASWGRLCHVMSIWSHVSSELHSTYRHLILTAFWTFHSTNGCQKTTIPSHQPVA